MDVFKVQYVENDKIWAINFDIKPWIYLSSTLGVFFSATFFGWPDEFCVWERHTMAMEINVNYKTFYDV